jgi:hypothetical protein
MAKLTTFVSTTNATQQYGLGLFQETTQGLTYWTHGGDTWGYKSKIMYKDVAQWYNGYKQYK